MPPTTKPYYPIPPSGIKGLIYALGIGVFISFFLWFFEPFNINIRAYSALQIGFFGVITFVVFSIAHTILPWLFPNLYQEKRWTVTSQVMFYLLILLCIASLNGLYINYLNDLNFSWRNYGVIITQTISIGIIPISLFVLFSFYWKFRSMTAQAASLNAPMADQGLDPPALSHRISTHIQGETFLLEEKSFLFAKASGNYIEVYQSEQRPTLYRMNLTDLGRQLANYNYMIRCHRSYLVNAKHIQKVTGNAQGLRLWLDESELIVPVSRTYIDKIKAFVAQD